MHIFHKWKTTREFPSSAWFVKGGVKHEFETKAREQKCEKCPAERRQYINHFNDWSTVGGGE